MADTFLSSTSDYFPELDTVLAKYPLDLRRTEQLLNDAGFARDGEGSYGQGGVRFTPQLAAFSGQGEREALILGDGWRRAGIETPIRVITTAQRNDLGLISTYPALRIEQTDADRPGIHHSSAGCARAERLWVGSNRGCFLDAEYDRLYNIFLTALDSGERTRAHIQALKLLSDNVAGIPLYYGYLVTASTANLVGPRYGHTNIHEWRWR